METFQSQSSALNKEILQIKKDINFYSSIIEDEKSQKLEQKVSELTNLFEDLVILKRNLDEMIELNQKLSERNSLTVKLDRDRLQQEHTLVLNENKRVRNELNELKECREKAKNVDHFLNESRNQFIKHQTHESQMNIMKNDYKVIDQIKQAEKTIVNSIEKYSKLTNTTVELDLIQYFIIELLLSVKISERGVETKNNCNFDSNYSHWYDIVFTNLPDDVLDFETNCENNPLLSKSKKTQLSKELLDKYRSIFKKRRKATAKNQKACIVLNETDDFQVMIKSYLQLLCHIMSKQEIEEAKKKFALDRMDGSQVLTILINSKSSKMATVVLPKLYPLCDPSLIKLISLSGYNNSDIINFKISKKVANLSEWISELTDLYNTNQIVSQ